MADKSGVGANSTPLCFSPILAAYCALYAVLYSNAREAIGNIGLAQNIGVSACMVAWLFGLRDRRSGQV